MRVPPPHSMVLRATDSRRRTRSEKETHREVVPPRASQPTSLPARFTVPVAGREGKGEEEEVAV